jgi:hypothetical protein
VFDPSAVASIALGALRSTMAPTSEADRVLGLAVRHGALTRYVPLRVTSEAPSLVFRAGERQIAVIDRGDAVRLVTLSPPAASVPDSLGGAIGADAPSGAFAIALEPDTSGATLARVADALSAYGARSSPAQVPVLLTEPVDGAVTAGVADPARSAALRAAVDAHRAEGRRCLEGTEVVGEGLAPRVDLHLTLDARGRITAASAQSVSARDETAARCVERAARRWRLPAPGAPAEVRALYLRASEH